jgi:hypothetical protein
MDIPTLETNSLIAQTASLNGCAHHVAYMIAARVILDSISSLVFSLLFIHICGGNGKDQPSSLPS